MTLNASALPAPEVSKSRQSELFAELGMVPVAMPDPFGA